MLGDPSIDHPSLTITPLPCVYKVTDLEEECAAAREEREHLRRRVLELEGSLADQQTDAQASVARLTAEVDRAKKAADEAHIALELGHGGRAEAEEALQQLTQVRRARSAVLHSRRPLSFYPDMTISVTISMTISVTMAVARLRVCCFVRLRCVGTVPRSSLFHPVLATPISHPVITYGFSARVLLLLRCKRPTPS